MLKTLNKFHFVGIGGAGMSGIAKILLEQGYIVSGSDLNKSATTDKLQAIGANIFIGHSSENIRGCEAIVVSTAIDLNNSEIVAARAQGVPVFHRSDVLAQLINAADGIAIAGAHGKTTTTSMIAVMLEQAGIDPTIIIGGELDYLGGNAKLGQSRFLVAEADESDGSFLKFAPKMAVVTNIESDHMDFYGTFDNILNSFQQFLAKLSPTDGLAILCFDNEHIRQIADQLNRPYISYALEHPAELTASNIRTEGAVTIFDVYRCQTLLGTVRMNVPGRHNVANALAAIAVGVSVGLSFRQIADGLSLFHGAKRRFQTKGRVNGVWVVDDYAHHPTEIKTTLQAARQTGPKRLICVFQPHRYSRTQFLRTEFGSAFTAADIVVLTDIYAAGEAPIPGVSGATIKEEVECQTGSQAVYIEDKDKVACYLSGIVEQGDLVVTMGAGNVYAIAEELVERLVQE